MKKLTLLIFIALSVACANRQKDVQMSFSFDDKIRFEKMNVRFFLDSVGNRVTLSATETEKGTWRLTIPDSIFRQYSLSTFLLYERSGDSLREFFLNMRVLQGNDTLYISNVYHFPRNYQPELKLRYDTSRFLATQTCGDMVYVITNPGEYELLNARISTSAYPIMHNPQKIHDYFTGMLREHPDSEIVAWWTIFYLSGVSDEIELEKLQQLYGMIPEDKRKTYRVQTFSDYLEGRANFSFDHFPNAMLPECNSGTLEPIIRDSSRYNLVIFSHSACGPCHAMIPMLKEVYGDLKDKIEFTYISADNQKFVNNWRRVMKEKEIPWRSLLAVDDHDNIMNRYQVRAYPLTYLVHPGGRFEKFELRNEGKRKELYELVKTAAGN